MESRPDSPQRIPPSSASSGALHAPRLHGGARICCALLRSNAGSSDVGLGFNSGPGSGSAGARAGVLMKERGSTERTAAMQACDGGF